MLTLDEFLSNYVQTAEGLSGLAIIAGFWHHIVCAHHRCYRRARATHNGLRVCARHHPALPDHGRLTREHIDG